MHIENLRLKKRIRESSKLREAEIKMRRIARGIHKEEFLAIAHLVAATEKHTDSIQSDEVVYRLKD